MLAAEHDYLETNGHLLVKRWNDTVMVRLFLRLATWRGGGGGTNCCQANVMLIIYGAGICEASISFNKTCPSLPWRYFTLSELDNKTLHRCSMSLLWIRRAWTHQSHTLYVARSGGAAAAEWAAGGFVIVWSIDIGVVLCGNIMWEAQGGYEWHLQAQLFFYLRGLMCHFTSNFYFFFPAF